MENCSRKILKPINLNANMRLGVHLYGKVFSVPYVYELLLLIYEHPYGISKEAIKAKMGIKRTSLTNKLKVLADANLIINKKFSAKMSKTQKALVSDYYCALIRIHLSSKDNNAH